VIVPWNSIANVSRFFLSLSSERIIELILQYPIKSSRGRIISLPEKQSLFEYIIKALGPAPFQ